MGRLRRFAEYRFIGRRDEMIVYDCDDQGQWAVLERAVSEGRLDLINQLSTFAPDTVAEARNRGFKPAIDPWGSSPDSTSTRDRARR